MNTLQKSAEFMESGLKKNLSLLLKTRKLALAISFFYFIIILILLVNRFWQYEVFYYDHGYAESAAYQTAHFKNPQWDREGKSSVFIDHFYPSLLMVVAPFYWLFDSYLTPVVIIAFLYGLSVYIAFEIGSHLRVNKYLLYVLLFAFMFYIGTQNAVIFFLKDISAATPFFLLMLLFLTKRSPKLYYFFLLFSLGFKETLTITTFSLGLATFIFFEKKWRKHALATMIISICYALLVSKVIVPFFFYQSFGFKGNYSFNPELNKSLFDYLRYFVDTQAKRETIFISLLSFGFLPLFTPIGIILTLQDFAQRFVLIHADNPFRQGLNLHYNINLAAILLYSSFLAVKNLQKSKIYRKLISIHALLIFLIVIILHQFIYHGPFMLLYIKDFYKIAKQMSFMDDFINKIPRKGKIMVQNNIAVRFTHDDYYLLSTEKYFQKIRPDVIAIDFRPGQNLNNLWPATEEEVKKIVASLEQDSQYKPIFNEGHRKIYLKIQTRIPTTKPSLSEPISLIFTGDVIPARSVNSQMVRRNNFKYPFEKTADFLKTADLTIINLEAPLIKNCPVTDSGMIFCGSEKFVEGLQFAGVDVVTLANNHSANYGKEGIDNTVRLLKENNIETTGLESIVYQEVKGIKFAFIGFNGVSPLVPYLATIDKEAIKKLVGEARSNADFVTVLFHWSQEYSSIPKGDTVAPFDPVEIAHFTIDCGADLIIGNHPHTVLGYEIYKDKLIFYALGNFIFDQMWSYETRIGAVLKLNLLGKEINSYALYPVLIEDYSQPKFLEGTEKEKVLDRMKKMLY